MASKLGKSTTGTAFSSQMTAVDTEHVCKM